MPHRHAFICTLLALTVPAALAKADYIDSAALREAGLVKFWQLHLPLQAGQEVADCYLVDDQLYLATQDGYVHALHAHTGAIRWIKQVTTAGYRIRRPCHAGDRAVFVTPSAMMQYDRYTGDPIRRVELRFPAGSAAISDGTRIYVGGIDQRIYAFLLDRDFESWKTHAGGQIVSQPVLRNEHLYFASENGTVWACVARNKAFYWRTRTVGSITADLTLDNENLYVACLDNSLFSFSPDDGSRRWRARFPGPLSEPPALAGDVAVQYCAGDGLTAVNTGTVDVEERVRWILPRGRGLLAAEERLAYVFSRDEEILVARLDDGEILHTIPAPGFTVFVHSPGDLALYVASKDGRVFCARKQGVPPVQAAEVRRALQQPTGPEDQTVEGAGTPTAGQTTEGDQRQSKRPGPPIGGKSKVSKQYTGD